jgi:anti-anti-sigma factor
MIIAETVAATAENYGALPEAGPQGITRLRLWGALTAPAAPRIRALLRHAMASGKSRLVVDLKTVSVIDVSGIAALLDALRAADEGGGSVLLEVNDTVVRALKASGTIEAFRPALEHGA